MSEFKQANIKAQTIRAGIGSLAIALTAAASLSLTSAATAAPGEPNAPTKVLTANFEPREVTQIEVGDFHFTPGQRAPIHTHDAPAVGYVAKGSIIYQVEGEQVQILREGDAFYEPVGPRILRFDNASATEEAIFIDFNLEQTGEPFIVFEQQPTEAIDRRTLPTIDLPTTTVSQVDIYTSELAPSQSRVFANESDAVLGVVSEGVVELRIHGQAAQRIPAGGTFSLPTAGATIANASTEVRASIVTFRLN